MSTTLLMSWFGYSESRPSLSQGAAGGPKPALDSELTRNLPWTRYMNLTPKIQEGQSMFRDGLIFFIASEKIRTSDPPIRSLSATHEGRSSTTSGATHLFARLVRRFNDLKARHGQSTWAILVCCDNTIWEPTARSRKPKMRPCGITRYAPSPR